MGTLLDFRFFLDNNLLNCQGSYSNQKIFQYDERPLNMIRSDRKILIFVKILMGKKLGSIVLIRANFTKFNLAL